MSIRKCDKCGARMEVTNTWTNKDGTIRRVRKCPKCGHRRATIER